MRKRVVGNSNFSLLGRDAEVSSGKIVIFVCPRPPSFPQIIRYTFVATFIYNVFTIFVKTWPMSHTEFSACYV